MAKKRNIASTKMSVEARFPTRAARDKADAAIERLSETEAMTAYIDLWLKIYRENGGIDKAR